MKPKWQKLASLAQEICTLWFQFFGAKDTLLRTIFIQLLSVLYTCLTSVKSRKYISDKHF